jgi:hypothetical protein
MSDTPRSTITLRALHGEPLADDSIRDMVIANANAIAERHGVKVHQARTTPESITVTLGAGRIEAFGFAAELRRVTDNWYRHKYGEPSLWGAAEDT